MVHQNGLLFNSSLASTLSYGSGACNITNSSDCLGYSGRTDIINRSGWKKGPKKPELRFNRGNKETAAN